MNLPNATEVRIVSVAEILPLRHAVLRPGRPLATAQFACDETSTRHFGAYQNGKLLAVASVFQAEMPEHPAEVAFQLRGMATLPEARGQGLGKALVLAAIGFARERGGHLLWCNARVAVALFYEKLGFKKLGSQFEIPHIGPHFRMKLRISPS